MGLASFFVMGFWWLLGSSPIEATVDKASVKTGEVFTYTITVEGSFETARLVLPDFQKVRIVSREQSREYRMADSKRQLKTVIRFSLFVPQPGVVKLRPTCLEDGKHRYKSRAVVIKVTGEPLQEQQKISPYIEGGTQL